MISTPVRPTPTLEVDADVEMDVDGAVDGERDLEGDGEIGFLLGELVELEVAAAEVEELSVEEL